MFSFSPAAFSVGTNVTLENTGGSNCPGDQLSFLCSDNATSYIKVLINGIEVSFISNHHDISAQRLQDISENGITTVMNGTLTDKFCPADTEHLCYMEMEVTFPARLDMKKLNVLCQSTAGEDSIIVGKFKVLCFSSSHTCTANTARTCIYKIFENFLLYCKHGFLSAPRI